MSSIDWVALGRPFEDNEVEWRIQHVVEDKEIALVVPYIQNRAIMNRLDEVVGPPNWKNEYVAGPNGGVLCGLSIRVDNEWITKWDGAENTQIESVKGGLSDSMKRSAVHWNIGRYLYEFDAVWHPVKRTSNGKSWKLVGDPKQPINQPHAPKSHLDDRRETRLDTSEKPAQAKGTVQRPFKTVEALVEWLRNEAKDVKARDTVISQGQASNIAQTMAKFLNENSRHYLLWLTWEIESSKELNEREWLTLKAWCASPIAQVEAEAKLVEAAYAQAVEKELASNG